MEISSTEFILYVQDQSASRRFYEAILGKQPTLDVPGMTEFELSAGVKLGLMPNDGIARILKDSLPHPQSGKGIPRCELYLGVTNVTSAFKQAVEAGAIAVDPPDLRNWGDLVAYVADPDGHVIALAQRART